MSLRSSRPRQAAQATAGAASPNPPKTRSPGADPGEASSASVGSPGLRRSFRLFRLFLREQADTEAFYSGLAEDSADQVARHVDLNGLTVVDVGGGAGYFTAAFRARGANCYLFEPDSAELLSGGQAPRGAVLADGYWLPVADGSADVCFSSNVLEHVADPPGLIEEMIRATKPGGLIYLSFTNWYSPWGGHEVSPLHLLGADFAVRRYLRRHGRQPKHRVGVNLYRVHVGPTLRLIRTRHDVQVVEAMPRYYPRWCRIVLRVPGLREFATWNLLLIVRRNA